MTSPVELCALYARALRAVGDVKTMCDNVGGTSSLPLERDDSAIEVLSAKEASFAAHKSFHAAAAFVATNKVINMMLS